MTRYRPAAAVIAMAVLAGCGTAAGPPGARHLARQVPGCAHPVAGTPSVTERQDVTCDLGGGRTVEIGTFATAKDERAWISSGGSPASPDPQFAGCCIQGNLWAATVDGPWPLRGTYRLVMKAIGGRMVQG